MTREQIEYIFENFSAYRKFTEIPFERRLSTRRDLNAFMVLDKLFPATKDIVACSEHDVIHLSVMVEDLTSCPFVTEDVIHDLICSGVHLSDFEGLAIFT